MELWTFLMGGCAFLGLFLAAVTLTQRLRPASAGWTASLLGAVSALLIEFLLLQRAFYALPVVFPTYPLVFVMGPALWFQARALSGRSPGPRVAALHLAPVALATLNLLPYYADIFRAGTARGLPAEQFVPLGGYEMMILHLGHLGLYVALAARTLRSVASQRRRLEAGAVAAEAPAAVAMTVGLGAMIAVQVILVLAMKVTGHHVDEAEYAMVFSLGAILLATGWMLARQPLVPAGPAPDRKYARSGLSAEAAAAHRRTLDRVFRDEALYLDPELTLAGLAEATGISEHQLSQVLNRELGVTFFDYVNAHRVRAAADRLLAPREPGETVLAVAFECGFSSKASFNRAFKQYTGMTPTEFRRDGSREHPVFHPLVSS